MIHFDFIVDDIDAENIMGLIDSEINKYETIRLNPKTSENMKDWFKQYIGYLEELKGKMKNTRVKEESD